MADIIVVGAGVVGLACAVEFQRRGHRVTLLDHAEPGRGCSLGNAGIIAASEVLPIISPKHLRTLPHMLLSKDAPASIRLSAFPEFAWWLMRAARTLRADRQKQIVAGLTALNGLALQAWRTLLANCDAQGLLIERGMVRLIRTERDRQMLGRHRDMLEDLSIPTELLSANQVHDLEPDLDTSVVAGLLHSSDAHVRNPLDVSLALLKRFLEAGGVVVEDRALSIAPRETGATVVTRAGSRQADMVIVAAGLASDQLIAPLGVSVPLQAERGYHLMLRGAEIFTSRPITFQAESCVATPMSDGLRLAGTVEFAPSSEKPTWSRADRLTAIAQRYFASPLPTSGADRWVGSRPSLPDSLPAIGRLRGCPNVGYAFGHQHLGLTQAAISAALLGAAMHAETPPIDLRPYDIARFS